MFTIILFLPRKKIPHSIGDYIFMIIQFLAARRNSGARAVLVTKSADVIAELAKRLRFVWRDVAPELVVAQIVICS